MGTPPEPSQIQEIGAKISRSCLLNPHFCPQEMSGTVPPLPIPVLKSCPSPGAVGLPVQCELFMDTGHIYDVLSGC